MGKLPRELVVGLGIAGVIFATVLFAHDLGMFDDLDRAGAAGSSGGHGSGAPTVDGVKSDEYDDGRCLCYSDEYWKPGEPRTDPTDIAIVKARIDIESAEGFARERPPCALAYGWSANSGWYDEADSASDLLFWWKHTFKQASDSQRKEMDDLMARARGAIELGKERAGACPDSHPAWGLNVIMNPVTGEPLQ